MKFSHRIAAHWSATKNPSRRLLSNFETTDSSVLEVYTKYCLGTGIETLPKPEIDVPKPSGIFEDQVML